MPWEHDQRHDQRHDRLYSVISWVAVYRRVRRVATGAFRPFQAFSGGRSGVVLAAAGSRP